MATLGQTSEQEWPDELALDWDLLLLGVRTLEASPRLPSLSERFPSPGIFPTQGLNLGLLHYSQVLCHLSHQEAL